MYAEESPIWQFPLRSQRERNNMSKRRELTQVERGKIIGFYESGQSYKQISDNIGCNKSTVCRIVKRFLSEGEITKRKRSGRPKLLSEKEEAFLAKRSLRDPKKTLHLLTEEVNQYRKFRVSKTTVRRALIDQDLKGRVAARKPLLRTQNVKKRLDYAIKHKNWSVAKWRRVLLTDESKFELFGTHR
jgi:transposase